MLTRIYGTAFFTQEGARASTWSGSRRRAPATTASSARELGLFLFSEARPGSPFWLPQRDGALQRARRALARERAPSAATREVKTPLLYDSELWKTSGHWDKYRENMFFTEVEDRPMGLKPMNCPAHCQLFAHAAVVLPRPARPLLRAGPAAPQRAQRHAARPAARPALHPGRRAHLLHRRAGPGRGASAAWSSRSRHLRPLRLRAAARALDAPREAHRQRRDVGPRPRARWPARSTSAACDYERQRGRRRLLRPEDRPAHDRLARPLVAARHRAARLLDARALRPDLHRRRQRRPPPGDDPPRAAWAPSSASSGSSSSTTRASSRCGSRRSRRIVLPIADRHARGRARGRRRAAARPACASRSTSARSRSAARSATPSCGRSRTCS